MNLDAVLKIGGSLGRGSGLEALCGMICRLGTSYRLLVVPGGGAFADQVRIAYRRFGLSETAAHCMALSAMDQYGYLLNHLISNSFITTDKLSACQAAVSGRVSVLLPSASVLHESHLPHSWGVTSDTIAAWVAKAVRSPRLFLLKDVDGLLRNDANRQRTNEHIDALTVEQLFEHTGGVDEYLANFLSSVDLETWVLSGMHPERLEELLARGHTTGTRILRS